MQPCAAARTRMDRWIAAAAIAAAWALTGDGVVLLVLILAIGRAFTGGDDVQPDRGALGLFVFVVLALALVFRLSGN
jgi:hypothetical protein